MPRILLVSRAPGDLAALAGALAQTPGLALRWALDPEQALAETRDWRPDLAVIDREPDPEQAGPWGLVRALLAVDAFLNTAVVSDRDPERFHAASEGLGVMTQLPSSPGPAEAAWLLYHLQELTRALAWPRLRSARQA